MKILYVEDNAVNLSLIQRIAQMNQHELVSYDEAEIALVELEKGLQVDLILLDIQLAGEMDGIEFAKALRGRGDRRPIIAITAYAMMGDKERILEAGCNEYLPKPLPIAEFLTLLAKYDPSVYKIPDAKPAETPAVEAKPVEAAPVAEAKPTETKPTEPPAVEAKPVETAPVAEAKPVEVAPVVEAKPEPPSPEVEASPKPVEAVSGNQEKTP